MPLRDRISLDPLRRWLGVATWVWWAAFVCSAVFLWHFFPSSWGGNGQVSTVADVELVHERGWEMYGSFGTIPLPEHLQPDPKKFWRVDIYEARYEWQSQLLGFQFDHESSELEARFLRPSTAPLTADQLWMCDRAVEYLRHFGQGAVADRLQARQWKVQSDRLAWSSTNAMHATRLLMFVLLALVTIRTLWVPADELGRSRLARGLCPRCTYPRPDTPDAACPECGHMPRT